MTNYDLGFDDDAPNDVRCPMTGGTVYKPKQPLATLVGEELMGEWILRIEDTKPGNGGNLQVFRIEICSNAVPDKPALIKNNRLEVAPGETEFILDENLYVEDPNNSANELTFTLVTQVAHGEIILDGISLNPGDQFTQEDILDGSLSYSHDDSEN